MSYTIIKVETTPNPNARKLIVEPTPGTIRSYFKADDAADDPLGSALFGITGITNVLIHTKFISVCVEPGTSWKPITKAIESVLAHIETT